MKPQEIYDYFTQGRVPEPLVLPSGSIAVGVDPYEERKQFRAVLVIGDEKRQFTGHKGPESAVVALLAHLYTIGAFKSLSAQQTELMAPVAVVWRESIVDGEKVCHDGKALCPACGGEVYFTDALDDDPQVNCDHYDHDNPDLAEVSAVFRIQVGAL